MDITNELQKIRVLFADDGFVSVLKEVAGALMSFIEGHGISGHEFAHDLAERGRAGAQEEMEMIRDQGPGITLGLGLFEDAGKPFQERLPIFVIKEDLSSFDSPGHNVLEEAGGVKSGLAGHGLSINQRRQQANQTFLSGPQARKIG